MSAAIGLPLLILAIVVGGWWYDVVLALVLSAATAEILIAMGLPVPSSLLWLLVALAGVLTLAARRSLAWAFYLLMVLILLSLALVALSPEEGSLRRRWLCGIGVAIYVGWLGMYYTLLRHLDHGRSWVFLALFTTFAYDTGAYAAGRLLGRHKLAPHISPGKTIEGAVGGLICSTGAAVLLNLLLGPPQNPALMAVLGAGLGVAAQLGDLAESAVKRALQLKDAGWLVPGHGGLLDRLDSLLFAGPVLYYFLVGVLRIKP